MPAPNVSPVRLLAWNVNYRTRPKPVSPLLVGAIAALEPDVAVLTEYVPGTGHAGFLEGLAAIGLRHTRVSHYVPKENGVLVASQGVMEIGAIEAPPIDPSMHSNFLHVYLTADGFEVLALRVPDYSKQLPIKRRCWDWILETARQLKDRPAVMLGDFNTDVSYPRARCGDRIAMLVNDGWQHAAPPEGASFWTLRGHGVRIDHAFVSKHFTVEGSQYVRQVGSYQLAGRGSGALSDHAALVVDIVPSTEA
jgi:endonuclease/exonuclease/phosphatase family metal-dependent hydrolase